LHPCLAKVTLNTNPEDLAIDCDALVLVTDWPVFQQLEYEKLACLMNTPLMIDGRNCLDLQILAEAGFSYMGIGRQSLLQPVSETGSLTLVANQAIAMGA
jgi:UDPglucose 6-dehydrogenase